ncbi:hypothetical protein [Streptomyces sp. NPDC018059]
MTGDWQPLPGARPYDAEVGVVQHGERSGGPSSLRGVLSRP